MYLLAPSMTSAPSYPTVELSLPSEFGYEKVARDVIAAFARRLGFDPEQVENLKTAIGEACINAIEHGNQRSPGLRVSVNCSCDEQQLTVEVCDQGLKDYQGFAGPAPIDVKICGHAPRRGMGLMIIAQLVDESGFDYCANGGNRFWFAIRRQFQANASHP